MLTYLLIGLIVYIVNFIATYELYYHREWPRIGSGAAWVIAFCSMQLLFVILWPVTLLNCIGVFVDYFKKKSAKA